MADKTDILGTPLTAVEQQLLDVYEATQALLENKDLTPAIECNVKEAVAALWCAVNDLCLTDSRPAN
jgi:hypothetical protein